MHANQPLREVPYRFTSRVPVSIEEDTPLETLIHTFRTMVAAYGMSRFERAAEIAVLLEAEAASVARAERIATAEVELTSFPPSSPA